MEITVRRAVAQDYAGLCALYEQVDALHRENLPHIFQKPAGPVREQDYVLELIADETMRVFVAEAGGELVGLAHAVIREAPPIPLFKPRRFAVVEDLVVSQDHWRKGIGRKLMQAVQDWAGAKGASGIELNVYEFNQEAIAFYEALDYRTVSRRMTQVMSEVPRDR